MAVNFFGGYPITPSSEIAEDLSSLLPKKWSKEWHILIRKLIQIHALAYHKPDEDAMDKMIFSRLLKQSEAESRMKLKLIVNLLDLEQQQMVISSILN